MEGRQREEFFGATLRRIPLLRNGEPIRRTYCAFWKKDNANPYTKPFSALLREQFTLE